MNSEQTKQIVRKKYGEIALKNGPVSCCGPSAQECGCMSGQIGYSEEELASLPTGADLGLGCGNPIALASLKGGETVLDLGSGAGIDCFLAAKQVGESGRVIGVDMTPEMLSKARKNAEKVNATNVEFRLGEIEHLPVSDQSVDLVISNCVINLVPEKNKVFADIFRVLKPGGRMMISDIVLEKELPETMAQSIHAYIGCIAGAIMADDYLALIKEAGFEDIEIVQRTGNIAEIWLDSEVASELLTEADITRERAREIAASITSIKVQGIKPA